MFGTVEELLAQLNNNGSILFVNMIEFMQSIEGLEQLQGENEIDLSLYVPVVLQELTEIKLDSFSLTLSANDNSFVSMEFKLNCSTSFLFTSYLFQFQNPVISVKIEKRNDDSIDKTFSALLTGNLSNEQISLSFPVSIELEDYQCILKSAFLTKEGFSISKDNLEKLFGEVNFDSLTDYFEIDDTVVISSIEMDLSITLSSINALEIRTKKEQWNFFDLLSFSLKDCIVQYNFKDPVNSEESSFNDSIVQIFIEGVLCAALRDMMRVRLYLPMYDGDSSKLELAQESYNFPDFNDIAGLFGGFDLSEKLPAVFSSSNSIVLKRFFIAFESYFSGFSYLELGAGFSDNISWEIIPGVIVIKNPAIMFSFPELKFEITGTAQLGASEFLVKTFLNLNDQLSRLSLHLNQVDPDNQTGVSFDDLLKLKFDLPTLLPGVSDVDVTLKALDIDITYGDDARVNNVLLGLLFKHSWNIFSVLKIENIETLINLNHDESETDSYNAYGNISGNCILGSSKAFPVILSIPEIGDWTLELGKKNSESGIQLPDIGDLLSLTGVNIPDFISNVLSFEDIELNDLLLTFPKPTEGIVNTAYFELLLTSEWSFTNALKLTDIVFQCGVDFTGTESFVSFIMLGKVTIAGVKLNTVITKTADGSWSFSISLDPSVEEKPNVKRMLSELLHLNLPGIFPDVTVSGMEFTGDITGDICNYKFNLLLTEVWNLKALTGLDIELKEISITGESNNGIIGGKITGIVELGGVTLSLSAGLAPSGGAGAGDLEFTGRLADGSDISIVDLLESIHINVSNIPILDTFEIDQLDFSFNTGTGKSDLVIGCGFKINLFGRSGLQLRGKLSFLKADSSSEMTGTITGRIYIKSLCFEASFPIENVDENHITLKLYLPKPGQPDNPTCVTCNIINENGNKRLSINLGEMNIFTMLEQLVNLMIPGMYLDFPSPWNRLESIQYSGSFILIIDLPQDDASPVKATIVIPVGLINKLPMIELNTFVMNCNFDEFTIDVQMVGEIFGIDYNSGFDLISEDPPTPALPMGLLDLRYAGFGRHVSLNEQTNYTSMREVIQKLRDAFEQKPNSVVGSNIFGALGYNSESDWLVGFDFTVAQFLRLSVIFNDPILYGMLIRLDGPAAGMFSGFEFEILYQRLAAGIGAYRMKLELPAYLRTIELGAVSLTLPFIGIDIYTNGNFKLDLGFPYQSNFERSFALSLFPFYGKGGFYFASLNGATSTSVPRIRNGSFKPVIEFGIGLQVGIGKAA